MLRFNLVRVEICELRPEVVAESDEVLVHYRSRTNVRRRLLPLQLHMWLHRYATDFYLRTLLLLWFNLVEVEVRELRPKVVAEGEGVLIHYQSRINVR